MTGSTTIENGPYVSPISLILTKVGKPLETPAMKSTQTVVNSERTADLEQKMIISHEDEKVALVLSLTGIFTIWFIFR